MFYNVNLVFLFLFFFIISFLIVEVFSNLYDFFISFGRSYFVFLFFCFNSINKKTIELNYFLNNLIYCSYVVNLLFNLRVKFYRVFYIVLKKLSNTLVVK